MVMLWGLAEDPPLQAVWRRLNEIGTQTIFVDQRRVLEYEIDLDLSSSISGSLSGPDFSLDVTQLAAAYLRQYNFEQLDTFEDIARGSEPWMHAAQVEDALTLWCELSTATVVNRPSTMTSNNSKPYQLEIIRQSGFAVPDTLITTDAQCVIAFRQKHKRIIYKSISSCRSIVAQFSDDDLATLEDVTSCPTQFQQFIDGVDYRIHVLNDRVFATRIVCPDDDYRYSERCHIEPATVPDDVSERSVALNRRLGLTFSGIDLRRSNDGEWYCFEVNPSPGYSYFDTDISRELAEFLASAA